MESLSPLYRPDQEHDGCGVGFVADIAGKRSRRILDLALEGLGRLGHRGATDADSTTGDGAGVLIQIPREFFAAEAGVDQPDRLAVGMVFLPVEAHEAARQALESAACEAGLRVLRWREVPIDSTFLGAAALRSLPRIEQIFLECPAGLSDQELEGRLYLARKTAERGAPEGLYVSSLSHRAIVYKGLLATDQLGRFYPDLRHARFETALAVFHQRYSTNTFPQWTLAQPFRMLAHNGEINTLQGNRNWMRAREADHARLAPILQPDGSDSAALDNALEAVAHSGRGTLGALMMLVPEAWENDAEMSAARRGFYEYHACITEPWDGPASLAVSDGVIVAAALDRNGLRPARYAITSDGLVVAGSEAGIVSLDETRIVKKGRLGPGEMIAVDTAQGRLLSNDEIRNEIASRRPYEAWVREGLVRLEVTPSPSPRSPDLERLQIAFGCTREEEELVIRPMAAEGSEPVGSMGDDTALSIFERRRRPLSSYFKQRFAQVTNPPIDPLRERWVMSLGVYLGRRGNIFEETPEHAELIRLQSPVLLKDPAEMFAGGQDPRFAFETLPCLFSGEMETELERLCRSAEEAVNRGTRLLVLTDRGIDERHAAIPMLLAVGAVHHHLIRTGHRMKASLVAQTGAARDIHQIALLLGCGASAVHPYLALETIGEEKGIANYKRVLEAGLLKTLAKMGISCLSSYQGAQLFEAIGLSREVIDRAFRGIPSRLGGIGLREIAEDALENHRKAFGGSSREEGSFYRFRRDGEFHAHHPEAVRALHRAIRSRSGEDWGEYRRQTTRREHPAYLRDLLRLREASPIPLEEVEPAESLVRRFVTASMSLGSLSPEAHLTLAIGMNRIGGKSSSGEGGEEPWRFSSEANSAVKQVASARFGVTPAYLAAAKQLEIKMAQGSKPGEGGQIPGHKVSPYIARVRRSVAGAPLISPPPHHDIYSIEDLAQLIHDLKAVNPDASVAVKLVSEDGVGTIAAGVVKAGADLIQISGHDGGTGASPLASIKHAGIPWELGLAEAQQVLVQNHLRGRVRLRVDGGLKTGRDIVIAALLGAEEFGFGTSALVAIGCKMARQCHLNTCPVGVATQREDLRKKFTGRPEDVVDFFTALAEEVRAILAQMGVRRLDEIVGRADLLEIHRSVEDARARLLDLEPLRWVRADRPRRSSGVRASLRVLDDELLERSCESDPIEIRNGHRSVGARIAGRLARLYGEDRALEPTLTIRFQGSAGQSFGAFCVSGLRLILEGEANDYVGKGMAGGEIVLRPHREAIFSAQDSVIVGNTVLYGATGGALFVAGRAGERFAVRNSGATAVVEGVGVHACEYMTDGVVVVLGATGRNFGAGMSHGLAYVLDERGDFPSRVNPEMVGLARLESEADSDLLTGLIRRHVDLTGSSRGRALLEDWERRRSLFWKVIGGSPGGKNR